MPLAAMEPEGQITSPALLAQQILVMAAVVVLEALVLRLALQAVPAS
jgi:hypothetical protein